MKSKIVPTILLTVFISIVFVGCYSNKYAKGNETAARIEKFRKEKGRLPDFLSEVGIEEREEGSIYYKKESETKYILWFGKTLGESAIYDSDAKEWR